MNNNNTNNKSSRYVYNKKILNILTELIEEYPDWRFGQLIQNIGIANRGDCFFIESKESYNNAIAYFEKTKKIND